jgi:pentatricopeptide repeat protein
MHRALFLAQTHCCRPHLHLTHGLFSPCPAPGSRHYAGVSLRRITPEEERQRVVPGAISLRSDLVHLLNQQTPARIKPFVTRLIGLDPGETILEEEGMENFEEDEGRHSQWTDELRPTPVRRRGSDQGRQNRELAPSFPPPNSGRLHKPKSNPFVVSELHGRILLRSLQRALSKHSLPDAWAAYQSVIHTHPLGVRLLSPTILRMIVSLLSQQRPRTRQTFVRLLNVTSELRKMGEKMTTEEWNALIDCAGKGLRKTRVEDYEAALGVYDEMLALSNPVPGASQPHSTTTSHTSAPDIFTFNTLLSIAARTLSFSCIQHAVSLLSANPQIVPDRITYITLMYFYSRTHQTHLVPLSLTRIVAEGWDVGIDGLNAAMWAYARSGQVNVAMGVYHALRRSHSGSSGGDAAFGREFEDLDNPILAVPGLVINDNLKPDMITYNLLIQALSYHGHLRTALRVFRDMVTSVEGGAPATSVIERSAANQPVAPILEVYYSLFLGFSRHVVYDVKGMESSTARKLKLLPRSGPQSWTLSQLDAIFQTFIHTSFPTNLSFAVKRKIVWLIMVAYDKASRDNVRLREVHGALEKKFGSEEWWARRRRLDKFLDGCVDRDRSWVTR